MNTTLLRGFNPLAWLVFLGLVLGLARSAQATHLLGGEMTYRYLDATGPSTAPSRYEITLTVYNTCGAAAIRPSAIIGIYDQATGAKLTLTTTNYASVNGAGNMAIPQTSLDACTTPYVPPGCTIVGTSQSYQLQKFVGIVNLPLSASGYNALWTDGNRNAGITNISNPSDYEYMTLYATLAPPSRPNSSPVFVDKAVANLCINDTTYLLNNATDADGDRLAYSLAQPYGFLSTTPPPSFLPLPDPTPYAAAQYTATTPLGTAAGNYAGINATTGIAKYLTTAALNSKFVVAIDVKEYRTIGGIEQLIGVTRRDLQLVVVSCPNSVAPVLPTNAVTSPTPRAFTIEAGSTLTIPLTATQVNGNPLTLTVSSVLLDGAGGYNATFAGSPGVVAAGNPAGTVSTPSTNSPVSGTFVYTAGCNDARATPYDVTLTAKDDACAGKTVGDVLRITVVKPPGPTAIAGSALVCGPNAVQSYTASGGTAPTVSWTVTGGTIVGSNTANPVQVRWPTAGTGTLTAQGITQYGCPTGQVTKTVTISPIPTVTVTGSRAICQGGSTTLTLTGGIAPYTLTGGTAPVSGAGPFVLSPTQTTTYTIVGTAGGSTCAATGQVTITVNPLPVATAGSPVSICSGGTGQLGAAAVAGLAYSWSPATGLSSTTAANPTVTLTNTTGAPTTQTYTLTTTNSATCTSTSTVVVTINPRPVAVAGAAVAFCSGNSAQLGAAPVNGLAYSWSPTTGLSSATVANPTVTLTNTTGAPVTQAYTLTTTNSATNCASTGTVAVTVNPLPVATAGSPVSICSGGTGQLGAAAVAGLAYSWSPATGLSSATAANPTVTLTNATSVPITQVYTLTATNSTTGCASTGTVVVTVNPLPIANAGAPVSICSGGSAQLGAAPVSGLIYSWSPTTGVSNPAIANPTVTLANATSGAITQTYTLTVTNSATNCASTGTVVVTVNPRPVATAGAAVAICSGGTGQLGAAAVAGNAYSWSPATGLSSPTVANPTVTLTNPTGAPTTQTYTLTVTNLATTCASTSTVVVTVNPLPVANAGAAVAICSGNVAQLGAAAVAGNTYSWSPATGLNSATVANPTVTLTNTTGAPISQTYTLTATNAAACTSTSTVVVTVNSPSVAIAGAPVTFCSGESAQLGATAVAGNTYSWSPATGLSNASTANPIVTLTNTTGTPITQAYTLTLTNGTGCVSTATVAVTVNPLPVAATGAAVAICSGGTGQLGAAAVAGNAYSWSPATGLSSTTVANPTVTLTNTTGTPITQLYTLTATNSATGCVGTGTVVVTVNPLPVATPGADITICSGATGQLGAAPVAGNTYSWSPSTGLSSATVANPTVTLPNTTGTAITQTYTLTVTNPQTCTSTATVAVTVSPAIVPGTIGADQTVCLGAVPAPLTSVAAASGGVGPYAYQWESSPDNVTWKAVANITSLSYAPTAVSVTTYYRRRVTAGTCGMAYTNVVTVIAQPLLVPGVMLPTLPAQCAGTAFTFTPLPTNAGAAPTYRWFVNNVLVGSGAALTSTTLADGDIVQVELTPTAGFCATGVAIASTRVSFTPVPTPTLAIATPTTLPVCAGAPVSFTLDKAINVGTNPQYQWQADGVAISGATSANFTSKTLRDGQAITLVVHTTNACGQPATATSNTVRVTVNPPVHVTAGPDKTITEGESVTLEGTADGNYPVTWTPSATLAFANGDQLHPVATPLATTTYTISAGAGYCAGQSSVTVTVLKRVRIPNAFSPNADNNDDTWQIANIEDYPGNHVQVFNRWGQKLFEATGYNHSSEWNGTYNGQPLPFGTYYYLVTLGNGKSYSGPITVMR